MGSFPHLSKFLFKCRILTLMSKLGVVGSTVLQQILLLVVSTFGAGKDLAGHLIYCFYLVGFISRDIIMTLTTLQMTCSYCQLVPSEKRQRLFA